MNDKFSGLSVEELRAIKEALKCLACEGYGKLSEAELELDFELLNAVVVELRDRSME